MHPPPPFAITVGRHRGTVHLTVRGELDIATAPLLRAHLTAAREGAPASIALDLEDVTFLDSCGLAVLLGAVRRAHRDGVSVVIVSASSAVWRLLRLCGLETLLGSQAPAQTPRRAAG
jgi:anti-sigma B factor antagonist